MADSYEFLKGHYDRIQSEQRALDRECGENHVIGERPDDCFACLSEQRDELLTALKQVEAEMSAGFGSSFGETREQVRRAIAKAQGA